MSESAQKELTNVWQVIAWWLGRHSPVLCVVLSVVIIWRYVVVPELERSHRQVLTELHQVARDQKEITDHLKTTAQILELITKRMSP